MSSEKSSGGIEDNSEEEDKAEDLSGEESSGKIEDESEEEDETIIMERILHCQGLFYQKMSNW